MKLNLGRTITAVALLATTASVGAAEFWTYTPGNGQLTVNNSGGGAGFAAVSVTGYSGVGGQFNGNFWDAGVKPADSFLRFFCIELGEHANAGPNPYASSIFNEDDLRKLYDLAYPNKSAGDFWNAGQTNFGSFADATSAAAFQVAVWEIVFDGGLDLSGGSFKWTGGTNGCQHGRAVTADPGGCLHRRRIHQLDVVQVRKPGTEQSDAYRLSELCLGDVQGAGARHDGDAGIGARGTGGGGEASARLGAWMPE